MKKFWILVLLVVVVGCVKQEVTVSPSKVVTPIVLATATAVAPNLSLDEILGGECGEVCAMQALQYLHENADSPRRDEVIEYLLNISSNDLPMDWLGEWILDEKVMGALNAGEGVPQEFLDWLARDNHGEWIETDLDGNGARDYVVALRWGAETSPSAMQGGMYWIHRNEDEFVATRIPTDLDVTEVEQTALEGVSVRPTELTVEDLTGDGRAEVAFTLPVCGNGCFYYFRVMTWDGAGWRDLWEAKDWRVDGGYTIADLPDGSKEIVATERSGPTLGSGLQHDYAVHFRLVGKGFAPVKLSSALERDEWRKNGEPMIFALQLLYANQFEDAMAVYEELEKDLTEAQVGPDWRPYYWYHRGMLHLVMGDLAGARQDWNTLRERFPDSVVSRDVVKNWDWAMREDGAWHFCNVMRAQDADWRPKEFSWFMSNTVSNRVLDWRTECDLRLLLPRLKLQRETLWRDLAAVGVNWTLKTDLYDLNRDGLSDYIGIVTQGLTGYEWVLLSDGEAMLAFSPDQQFPRGTMDLDFVEGRDNWNFTNLEVTELDNDQLPEIVLENRKGFLVQRWNGERFERLEGDGLNELFYRVPFGITADKLPRELVASLETIEGNLVELKRYQLEGGELKQVFPPVPEPRYLSEALAELFRYNRPQRAWGALDNYVVPVNENDLTLYLRALTFAYRNEPDTARVYWQRLVKEFPNSDWAGLAWGHLKQ